MFRIRGHHLLCIQGFRGRGYDREFTANLAAIHLQTLLRPETEIQIISGTDDICARCPKNSGGVCGNPDRESEIKRMDAAVLASSGLKTGETIPAGKAFRAVNAAIGPAKAAEICGECKWRTECAWLSGKLREKSG